MGKNRSFTVCNQEKPEKFIFSALNKNKVEVTTDAMSLSSHGGLLLLQQEEERLALSANWSLTRILSAYRRCLSRCSSCPTTGHPPVTSCWTATIRTWIPTDARN